MTDLDRPPLDGELIDLPPEPAHDHIVVTGPTTDTRYVHLPCPHCGWHP